jgi:hypothetical protein
MRAHGARQMALASAARPSLQMYAVERFHEVNKIRERIMQSVFLGLLSEACVHDLAPSVWWSSSNKRLLACTYDVEKSAY